MSEQKVYLGSHQQDVVLYVMMLMNELKEEGLVEGYLQMDGQAFDVSPKGVAAYDQMTADGFTPTEEEVASCIKALMELE